ncbi:MAG: aminotransferase class IV [Fuerstia sp.]|nr:aminotransferase class IV [Fuerstiella sp.]
MTAPIAWMNGELIPYAQAAVPVWDLGVVAGASVSEMARTFAHKPFRLAQHLDRLQNAIRSLGFPEPYDRQQILHGIQGVLAHNLSLIPDHRDLGIVIFSTAGPNPTYLGSELAKRTQATTAVHTFDLPLETWRPQLRDGVRLRTTSVRQIPDDCFDVSLKVRNRLHWWLADQEATQLEPGSKALLLDHAGFITETSTSAVHLVCHGRIITSDSSVLNSLSSQLVEEFAGTLGIPFERRPIPFGEFRYASEAFLSSSAATLLPVSHVNGEQVGKTIPGPVFSQMAAAWSELVGIDIVQQVLGAQT